MRTSRLFASFVLASASVACARTPAARGPGLLGGAPHDIREACVPQGPERCFNARDDNCNGLIDEGCGGHTGLVQFSIAWDSATADVDLLVTDPKGELSEVGRPTASGLVKERDCPGPHGECHGENYENVYLEKEDAPRGEYRVKIRLARLGDDDAPVRITFGARLDGRTAAEELVLTKAGELTELDFRL